METVIEELPEIQNYQEQKETSVAWKTFVSENKRILVALIMILVFLAVVVKAVNNYIIEERLEKIETQDVLAENDLIFLKDLLDSYPDDEILIERLKKIMARFGLRINLLDLCFLHISGQDGTACMYSYIYHLSALVIAFYKMGSNDRISQEKLSKYEGLFSTIKVIEYKAIDPLVELQERDFYARSYLHIDAQVYSFHIQRILLIIVYLQELDQRLDAGDDSDELFNEMTALLDILEYYYLTEQLVYYDKVKHVKRIKPKLKKLLQYFGRPSMYVKGGRLQNKRIGWLWLD